MHNIKEITSITNPHIVELSKLNTKKNRLEAGCFIVEGKHLVEEANKHKVLKEVLISDESYIDLSKINATIIKVTDQIIKKLSTTKNPQPVLGVCEIIAKQNIKELASKASFKGCMLDGINDPGNLGTLIRTAASLGYDAVIASKDSVDYYNEKTIRASQGAIFKIPLISTDLVPLIKEFKKNDILVYGTSLKRSVSIYDVKKPDKLCLVFGNEARGISDEVLDVTSKNIILPMKKDVESLNVTIASSIIMYEFIRSEQ